jgi:hypothetical protein
VEPNEVDILAFTVLRNLKQINDAQESRLAGQCLVISGKLIGSMESISISPSSIR